MDNILIADFILASFILGMISGFIMAILGEKKKKEEQEEK